MANVAALLEQQPLTNDLDRAVLNIWLGKIFVFFNSLNKQEEGSKKRRCYTFKQYLGVVLAILEPSKTIVASATTESEKNVYFKPSIKAGSTSKLGRFRIAITWLNICIASRSNRVVVFDNRDIDPIKVAHFFEEKASLSTNTAPVFLVSVPSIIDTPVGLRSYLLLVRKELKRFIRSVSKLLKGLSRRPLQNPTML